LKTLTEDEKGILAKQILENWKKDEKLRAEFGNNFAAYSAFFEAEAAGKVKILGGKVANFSKESFSNS